MRINACKCTPLGKSLGDRGGWACESATVEDAVSPTLGIADLEVLDDLVLGKTLIAELPHERKQHLIFRRIRGHVAERLGLWGDLWDAIVRHGGSPPDGLSLPEEGKVFLPGQVLVSYDFNDGLVEIAACEIVVE
jgi:hypothetical protein